MFSHGQQHEAVMSTDDAIHRMAQAFDRTRFSPARSPSTPHRQGTRHSAMKQMLKSFPRHQLFPIFPC